MSTQQPAPTDRVPFFIRALNGIPDHATNEGPRNDEEANQIWQWDTTHMSARSYLSEPLNRLDFPPHRVLKDADANPMDKNLTDDHYIVVRMYDPFLLPELSDVQVNELSGKFLSDINIYNTMQIVLKRKVLAGELEKLEYEDYKEMLGTIKQSFGFTEKQKRDWQRRFVTYVLLWMISVDARYGFDLAEKYVSMIEVRQVTLIYESTYFALYPNVFSPEEVKERTAFRKQFNEQKAAEKKAMESKKDEVESESEENSD